MKSTLLNLVFDLSDAFASLTARATGVGPRASFRSSRTAGILGFVGCLAFAASIPAIADDEWVTGELIVTLQPGVSVETINDRYGTTTLDSYEPAQLYLLFYDGSEEVLEHELDSDPDIRSADLNLVQETPEGVRQLILIAVGGEYVDYVDQSVTERIGLDLAHAVSRGAGITVAVVDGGVDPNHEALVGHLASDGWDFVDEDGDPTETANGIDDDGDSLIDEGFGHGTMVAGIVALVAPEATILPIRILDDEGRTTAFRVCKAIRYADDHGAKVINLSLGVPQRVDAIGFQLEEVGQSRALAVAGAGNENRSSPAYYPAADERAIMVAALDSMDVKAGFSDWGSKVELCAPGTGIRSAFPDGGWALGSGCSFATPFVSGAAALYLSAGLAQDAEQLRE
ncbi:MAG: S8 family serine peptidase, partial [Candidatus Eisenbacteria bacterium]|nr:S8 family serine peptidase [Candidatus Eisenbacteria bacterium]